ncbi:MAG: hypothetical protein SF051_13970 [Elusimicrobiota bacterium]|nr:hypothetical protein [Elusimicrobiota bacterium]
MTKKRNAARLVSPGPMTPTATGPSFSRKMSGLPGCRDTATRSAAPAPALRTRSTASTDSALLSGPPPVSSTPASSRRGGSKPWTSNSTETGSASKPLASSVSMTRPTLPVLRPRIVGTVTLRALVAPGASVSSVSSRGASAPGVGAVNRGATRTRCAAPAPSLANSRRTVAVEPAVTRPSGGSAMTLRRAGAVGRGAVGGGAGATA